MNPREHHYLVAHKLIPAIFYDNPLDFLASAHAGKDDFGVHIWQKAGEDFIEDESERIPAAGLSVQPFQHERIFGAVFIFPEPQGMVEAYMTCAVGKLHKSLFGRPKLKQPNYYTLELGESENGQPRAVLCSWNKKGAHANYGDGPAVDPRAFIECCISTL